MKKFKSAMIAALSGIMLFSSCSFFAPGVKAVETATEKDSTNPYLFSYPRDAFEFSAEEMLHVYALNSSSDWTENYTKHFYVRHRMDLTDKNVIPLRSYNEDGTFMNTSAAEDKWSDGKIDAVDASNILALGAHVNGIANLPEVYWPQPVNDILWSLAKALNVSKDDVTLESEAIYQKIEGLAGAEKELITVISSTTGPTPQNDASVLNYTTLDRKLYIQNYKARHPEMTDEQIAEKFEDEKARPTQMTTRITVTAPNGDKYRMVLGNDNKFYLLSPNAPKAEFKTTLDYASEEKGKMDGDTYLPPYYENEEKNAKKDLDATAIIKSTTNEEIIKTNGVELTTDGKANSQGWYYPDVNDKRTIAKVYPFDKYDNTTDNGAVKETVKLTGAEGGEDSQSPSIRWTFRLINRDDKENADGSITVTLTYNLPVDPDSIPEGWTPVYDKDGKTIHAITKTIKKGENYDKDVTVKRNGPIDEKVTTHVKKEWEKLSPTLPQTGIFSVVLVVIVAGAAIFAITRYRKINN